MSEIKNQELVDRLVAQAIDNKTLLDELELSNTEGSILKEEINSRNDEIISLHQQNDIHERTIELIETDKDVFEIKNLAFLEKKKEALEKQVVAFKNKEILDNEIIAFESRLGGNFVFYCRKGYAGMIKCMPTDDSKIQFYHNKQKKEVRKNHEPVTTYFNLQEFWGVGRFKLFILGIIFRLMGVYNYGKIKFDLYGVQVNQETTFDISVDETPMEIQRKYEAMIDIDAQVMKGKWLLLMLTMKKKFDDKSSMYYLLAIVLIIFMFLMYMSGSGGSGGAV